MNAVARTPGAFLSLPCHRNLRNRAEFHQDFVERLFADDRLGSDARVDEDSRRRADASRNHATSCARRDQGSFRDLWPMAPEPEMSLIHEGADPESLLALAKAGYGPALGRLLDRYRDHL